MLPSRMANESESGFDAGCIYMGGAWLTGVITFIGCWIYCIAEYGFLFGVGLGWLPSGICAVLAALLWPLIALLIAGILFLSWSNH